MKARCNMSRFFERAWENALLTVFVIGTVLGILWATLLAGLVLLTAWSMWVQAFGGGLAALLQWSGHLLTAIGIVLAVRLATRFGARVTRLLFGARTRLT